MDTHVTYMKASIDDLRPGVEAFWVGIAHENADKMVRVVVLTNPFYSRGHGNGASIKVVARVPEGHERQLKVSSLYVQREYTPTYQGVFISRTGKLLFGTAHTTVNEAAQAQPGHALVSVFRLEPGEARVVLSGCGLYQPADTGGQ